MRVKFYGGPYHGRQMAVNSNRVEVAERDLFRCSIFERDLDRPPPTAPPMCRKTYLVEQYSETRSHPTRFRTVTVAKLEGVELFGHEEAELLDDLARCPWTIPTASFLNDFEQWLSGCVYRHTGRVYWRRERVE